MRVVVIAGNGAAFCAGHDLKQMRANPDKAYYQKLFAQCSRMMLTITRMPAAGDRARARHRHRGRLPAGRPVRPGGCLGHAKFAVSGINVGLFCSTPSVPLGRNVLRKQAMEMLLTGEFIDAATAKDYGLVNAVAPPTSSIGPSAASRRRIIAKSPVAVSIGKRMFYRQLEMGLAAAYDYAAETMACNMMAADAGEGIDAFIEKRPPQWTGR